MNKSDKLFMETAEKQQKIIDVLLEVCKEAHNWIDSLLDRADLSDYGLDTKYKLQQAIEQAE